MKRDHSSDRIERSIAIDAPRERVWRALADAETFGRWFGANLDGQTFVPGKRVFGPITQQGFEHASFDVVVDQIEPQRLFSFRWHPYSEDAAFDVTQEVPTHVVFSLADAPGNSTLLTVVESGFESLKGRRYMDAFRMNSQGWEQQLGNIDRYVAR